MTGLDALQTAIAALAALGLATGMARSAVVYAAVSASHVLGIALLLGPVLLADLRLAGSGKGWLASLDAAAFTILRRTALCGVLLAIATGILLLSAKPADYAANPAILAKLVVIAAGLINALRFELLWRRHGARLLEGGAVGSGVLSIILWITALFLGRWIAFV